MLKCTVNGHRYSSLEFLGLKKIASNIASNAELHCRSFPIIAGQRVIFLLVEIIQYMMILSNKSIYLSINFN